MSNRLRKLRFPILPVVNAKLGLDRDRDRTRQLTWLRPEPKGDKHPAQSAMKSRAVVVRKRVLHTQLLQMHNSTCQMHCVIVVEVASADDGGYWGVHAVKRSWRLEPATIRWDMCMKNMDLHDVPCFQAYCRYVGHRELCLLRDIRSFGETLLQLLELRGARFASGA